VCGCRHHLLHVSCSGLFAIIGRCQFCPSQNFDAVAKIFL
jgi:hypothetical protein